MIFDAIPDPGGGVMASSPLSSPNGEGLFSAATFGAVAEASRVPTAVLDPDLMVSGWNRAWATCVGEPAGLDEVSLDEVIAPCPGIVDCRNWARLARPDRPPFIQIGVRARQAAQEQFEGELLVISGVESDISLLLLVTREAASQTAGADGTTPELSYLTSRERQICELLAKGQSGPAIALTLGVSPATVQAHVRNAMAKSGARTRTGLVAMALADGLIAA